MLRIGDIGQGVIVAQTSGKQLLPLMGRTGKLFKDNQANPTPEAQAETDALGTLITQMKQPDYLNAFFPQAYSY